MSKRVLVDVQLDHNKAPVGDRYVTEMTDVADPADRAGLFDDALTHHRVPAVGHRVTVFRRGTEEVLFTYPAA